MTNLKNLAAKTILGTILLTNLATAAFAGRVEGRFHEHFRVPGEHRQTHTLNFYRGEYAAVEIEGDGDTDLDLYIYDENGTLVAKDIEATDSAAVSFYVPRTVNESTARYRVIVLNRGGVYNDYHMDVE